jgi:hypothetical protein
VDCEYLSKDANQKELAEKIGCAIQQYFYGLEQADSSQEKVPLSDLDGHWAQDAITSVYEKGVVSGYEDGTFQPEKTISRAEFLQVLYNVYGNGESADISFSDVPESAWYYDCVKWGVASGLVTGYGDYTFRADQEITREEAAVILSRCSGLPAGGSSVAFKDSNAIAGWAKDGVAAVSKAGVMQGSSSGYFNPKKMMTRAEAAVIASRLL